MSTLIPFLPVLSPLALLGAITAFVLTDPLRQTLEPCPETSWDHGESTER